MTFNRAQAIDEKFRSEVFEHPSPTIRPFDESWGQALSTTCSLSPQGLLEILHSQITSRTIDLVARELRARDEGFYTISSSGHEGNAIVAFHSKAQDMCFLHYRAGAFMLQKSRQLLGATPIFDICLSIVASSEDPVSGGRHNVWGNLDLNVPPQTSTIASHLPKTVGAALAHHRSSSHQRPNTLADDSIYICSFGDASLNHSTAQGALNTASWIAYQNLPLPVLFLCEDNGLGISVNTPRNWVHHSARQRPAIRYFEADGTDILAANDTIQEALDYCRQRRRPTFLHLHTRRILGHAGSDPEYLYRKQNLIEADEQLDPVLKTAKAAIDHGLITPHQVLDLYDASLARVRAAAEEATKRPKHEAAHTIMEPLQLDTRLPQPRRQSTESQRRAYWKNRLPEDGKPRHMARLLNTALHDLMEADDRIILFGEDVAKRGGVYSVSSDLCKRFGARRVFNTLLDEQSILGLAIGAAHVGLLPIPEIQYLAYLYNAIDQVRGEACSLRFFSKDQFSNPMVIRIASFAYQRGFGGHFHNDNGIASLREIPGLIMAAPASAADSVLQLRTCIDLAREQKAVVAFLEPIALYMKKDLLETGDGLWQEAYPDPSQRMEAFTPAFHGPKDAELLIITYSNGTFLSRQAAWDLEQRGHSVRILDLRWLLPLPEAEIIAAAKLAKKVLIVDESRRTGSPSEMIMTLLCERLGGDASRWRRLTGDDTFIPLGRAWTHVLPSRESIFDAALAHLSNQDNPNSPIEKATP